MIPADGGRQSMLPKSGTHFSENSMLNLLGSITLSAF
jgi:hypothetical protein